MRRLARGAVVLALGGCVSGDLPVDIRLDEVARFAVDPAFGVPEGVTLSDDGRVIMWTGNRVFSERGALLTPVQLEGLLKPVAVWKEVGRTVVVDGLAGERLEFPPLAEIAQRGGPAQALSRQVIVENAPGMSIIGAVGAPCGTIVAQLDSIGLVHVSRVAVAGGVEEVPGPWQGDAGGRRGRWVWSGARRALILTRTGSPFTTFRIDCDQVAKDLKTVAALDLLTEDGDWRSLGPAASDRFAIRTISDVRSDHRVLVSYNAEGREVRGSIIETPLAIVAASPDGRYALGVQSLGNPEIVKHKVTIQRR